MLTTDIASGLLQVLLKCLATISKKRFKTLVNKLMSICFPKNESDLFENIAQALENSSLARYYKSLNYPKNVRYYNFKHMFNILLINKHKFVFKIA